MSGLVDWFRHVCGGKKKEKSVFASEEEAYKFCNKLYKKTGGATPELRRAYEHYQRNMRVAGEDSRTTGDQASCG